MKPAPKIIPAIGDEWEFRFPGGPVKRKIVGRLSIFKHSALKDRDRDRTRKRKVYVHWRRLPKGRYTGLYLRTLMILGKRVSTKSERDAAIDARIAARA